MKAKFGTITIYLFDKVETLDTGRAILDFIRFEDDEGNKDGIGMTVTSRFIADPTPISEIKAKVNASIQTAADAVDQAIDDATDAASAVIPVEAAPSPAA